MNRKYSNVLALELAIYQVHDQGYNPSSKIGDFWKKYDINTISTELKNALVYKKSANIVQRSHQQLFTADLMQLLIAYFHVHTDQIDISQLDISAAETTAGSLNALESTKCIHEFFGRITDQSQQ